MYKNMKKVVASALCSLALAGLFATQVSAYENEAHEVNYIGEVYRDEMTDFLEEYRWYPEEETADDRDDLSEEDTDDVEVVEDLPDIDTNHAEYDTVEVLEDNITDNAMDAFVVVETDEVNEQADEEDDEHLEDWDELNTWTLEELLHELALLEQIQTQPHTEDLADIKEDEIPLTDVEIEDILNGAPTTLEELELYFYTKLSTDPFLMEYFYKNLNTDKLLVEYFKGVEAFDLPAGYFTRTDEDNRKLRAYFYQVLQVDPYFRDYFYRSEDTAEALEDKEMTEGTTFFKRGGRRTTYRPAPKPVYRPRQRPVSRPVNRPKQVARPVAKLTSKTSSKPATRPVTRPNIAPIPPKSTPPKPNPPMRAPKTSSALEAADNKVNTVSPLAQYSAKELQQQGWKEKHRHNSEVSGEMKKNLTGATVNGVITLATTFISGGNAKAAMTVGSIGAGFALAFYNPSTDYSTSRLLTIEGDKHMGAMVITETYKDEARTELIKQTTYGPVYGPK